MAEEGEVQFSDVVADALQADVARLGVERVVGDVDVAVGDVDSWRIPDDFAAAEHAERDVVVLDDTQVIYAKQKRKGGGG